MSTVTPIIDHVEDLWPADGAPDDALGPARAGLAPARRQPRRVELRRRQHVGQGHDDRPRRAARSARCGSRAPAAIWRRWARSTSPALRLDEVLPLMERDEMSDEDMVAYLARCQLDPADAARVDRDAAARVRPGAARAPHAPGRDQRARRHGRRRAARSHECFGDEAAWIPYIRPGFTLSKQVGEAVRDNPGLKLVVLAKHGLIVWGDTAEEAYRKTIEVINQAVAFVNERTGDVVALRRAQARSRPGSLTELLPAIRGAVPASARRC